MDFREGGVPVSDEIDRIRAQYTGAHRMDPPGSVAADLRTLLAEIDRLTAERDRARREAIGEAAQVLGGEAGRVRVLMGDPVPDAAARYADALDHGAAMLRAMLDAPG